jgi:hypothetical protein
MVRASLKMWRTLKESVAGPGAHVQLLHRGVEEAAPGVVDGTLLPLAGSSARSHAGIGAHPPAEHSSFFIIT